MQIILFIKINMAINEKSYSDLPQMRNQPQESWTRSCRVLNNLCFCSLCPRDAAAALMGRPSLFFGRLRIVWNINFGKISAARHKGAQQQFQSSCYTGPRQRGQDLPRISYVWTHHNVGYYQFW